MIHPSAHIHPSARLGKAVVIGPFAIIEADVTIGNECEINAQAVIKKGSVLGEKVKVDHFAVVGGDPQDLHFKPSISSNVSVGDFTIIREHVLYTEQLVKVARPVLVKIILLWPELTWPTIALRAIMSSSQMVVCSVDMSM